MATAKKHAPRPARAGKEAKAKPQSAPADKDGKYVPPITVTHPALLSAGRDDGFRAAIYLMNMVLSRLQTCRESFGRSLGLTGTQYAVLMGVAHRQNTTGITIRTLALHLAIAPTHVTTEVRRLVDMGLLEKGRHGSDGRSVLITLTAMGQDYVEQVSPLVRRVNDYLFSDITREGFDAFKSCLSTVALNSELALAELRRHNLSEKA